MTTRVPPIEQWPSELLSEAERVVGGPVRPDGNVYRTLANQPKLFLAWLAWGGHLLRRSTLDPRHRELAILRTTALTDAGYPFTQHVRIGRSVGLTDADLNAVLSGPADPHWSVEVSAMLAAVDQLKAQGSVDDACWSELAAAYDTAQILDLVATVAFYRMAGWMLNTCGTPLDDGQDPAVFTVPGPEVGDGSIPAIGPRIGPLPLDRWSETLLQQTLSWPRFADQPEKRRAGVYCTLANHPALFLAIGPFMAHLLVDNELSDRHRELVIVRSCLLDRGAYPYRQHVQIAAGVGVDEASIATLTEPHPRMSDPADAAVVALVDELHHTNQVSDETWAAASDHVGTPGILDAIATAGFYGLISFALNVAATPLEPGPVDLPPSYTTGGP